MGGGVSSLPAEVTLAEAKELVGARWQPAWEEKFAEAKISKDEALKCWKETEAEAAISEELYEKLHGTNRSRVAEALDFSAIVNEKRGQHLPGTREWVFEAVMRWRTDPDGAKLFWLVGGGGTGKSVAAAELLARLLDKENAAAWHFCKHTEPARSAPAALLRSLAGMLCATVEGFEDALRESGGGDNATDKVDELFQALIAEPLQNVEAPRGADDALVLIIDALDELPRDALKPVLSLLANELKTLPPWIKIVVTSRNEAQIKAALKGYTPSELRVDEARNRHDVRAYLTVLAKKHVELEVTMESLQHEVEAKFPGLKNLDTFADLEDPLRRSKGKAGGSMLYARLIADQLEATTGKIDFASVGALPAGLDEIYAENFRRVFVDDAAWRNALPLVELVCAAREPLTIDAASGALGWDRARCERLCADVSLLFPLREGIVIGVLHKTVTDWLMGEAPFDKRSSEDAFFVVRDAAHRRLARACARTIRTGVLDTESYSSDVAADEVLASYVEGEGGVVSDAYALRWCLFHMKRSNDESESVAVAYSLSYVLKRSDGDIVSFVADLNVLQGQDILLLSDSLVLSRRALSLGVPLVEQMWQRLVPRADAASAASHLAEDLRLVASKLPFSAVRSMGLTEAGGAERCQIEVGARCLAAFVDPATGEPRLVTGAGKVFDPVAGGAALIEIIGGSQLAIFTDPATGAPRLACAANKEVNILDPVTGGEALLVLDIGEAVDALEVFTEPVTGAPRLACAADDEVSVFDPIAGGEALLVIDVDDVTALEVFVNPTTGAPQLACASRKKVLVFDPVAGGDALLVLDIYCNALAVFKEPATSAPRLACGSDDGKVRIFDAVAGGDALLVLDDGHMTYNTAVNALVIFKDQATGALRLASGSQDGRVRVYDPVAGGKALVVLEGHTNGVYALEAFEDPTTDEPRLVSASYDRTARVWNPGAGAAAIAAEPEDPWNANVLVTFVDPAKGAVLVATGSGIPYCHGKICVWDAETGNELLVINVGDEVIALVSFVDPATGAPRLACGSGNWSNWQVKIFDPVAGGGALLVINADSKVNALAFFKDPAMGAPRLAYAAGNKVRVFDPVAGGKALFVIDVGSKVNALAGFADPATGALRLACGLLDGKVRIFVVGDKALQPLLVLKADSSVNALAVVVDPATGTLRLASGSEFGTVQIWDLTTGGTALFVLNGHMGSISALTAFAEPATGEQRLVSGSKDKTLRVWDTNRGVALRVLAFDDEVNGLTVGRDMSGLFVALGKRWGELRVKTTTTPLTLACYKGDVDAISALLQQGAGVDQEDGDGYTPLFFASSKGHANAARLLLDAGAAVDTRRAGEWSPFGIACVRGHLDVATLLVERGAAVDLCLDGTTPLLFACRKRDFDAMRLCLEHGADVNWANEHGETILYEACTKGHVEAARLLLEKGAEVDRAEKEYGRTPLGIACQKGHVDAARLLLAKGAEVDRANKNGETPLFVACGYGHVEAARLLLGNGAEVDWADEDGRTQLYIACQEGHVAVATLLLGNGANVDWANTWGETPLFIACQEGHVDAARLCLDRGADMNLAADDGWTPLLVACQNGHVDAARLLLDKGADANRPTEDGHTPLLIARSQGYSSIVALLEDHLYSLHAMAKAGDVDAMTRLLDDGAAIDQTKADGQTPLWTASSEGHVEVCRLLLDRGASVDHGDDFGQTPLWVACSKDRVDVARLLLEEGADASRVTKEGTTSMDIAQMPKAIVELFDEMGLYDDGGSKETGVEETKSEESPDDVSLSKPLQEEEGLWGAHQLASADDQQHNAGAFHDNDSWSTINPNEVLEGAVERDKQTGELDYIAGSDDDDDTSPFAVVSEPPADHAYGHETARQVPLKQVRKMWAQLMHLPPGIHVRAFEKRMDLLRAVIVGPTGTPYDGFLFWFDLQLPEMYPRQPPSMRYHAWGLASRLNPNLYANGKVCLSLLGTWHGPGWDPESSTLLQLLVSVQGLVLVAKPYFNEPAWEEDANTVEGEQRARWYNEGARLLALQATTACCRRPPRPFRGIVVEHFARVGPALLDSLEAEFTVREHTYRYRLYLRQLAPPFAEAIGQLRRAWGPEKWDEIAERSNNTSGLLTGPEYSSDDIGDGPVDDAADLDELGLSAIGHSLVVLEQGAAFRRIELGGQPRRAARADRRIDIPPDTVIGQKYRINRKIGSGSFGEIYSGTVIYQDSNQQVAIKFEKRSARSLQLRHEFKVYRELQGCTGIGRVMYFGKYRDCNVMVMERLGPSLEDLFNQCGRRFSLKTTLQLADKLLERAESLHENHLIHRDIKPANFVVSPGKTAAEVFCIDFGLSKRYRHPQTLQHIPYREDRSLTGTPRYASLAIHQGKEASRRDDLESIGYMLVYFLLGRLPWQGLKVPHGVAGTASQKHRLILDKKTTPLPELCQGCPIELIYFYETSGIKDWMNTSVNATKIKVKMKNLGDEEESYGSMFNHDKFGRIDDLSNWGNGTKSRYYNLQKCPSAVENCLAKNAVSLKDMEKWNVGDFRIYMKQPPSTSRSTIGTCPK